MASKKKAVIFAPFWQQAGHVGNNRVDRFVRWLSDDGYFVVMIRAGTQDKVEEEPWGQEITIKDKLGLYRDISDDSENIVRTRRPNKWRRTLAYWLLNPDPSIVWAKSAAKKVVVLNAISNADFILSSSPPESSHVGAWLLSRRSSVPHIVDLRDGWLDEPLRPILRHSLLRRRLEGRLERQILCDARGIFVTSDVWQFLLNQRYPSVESKIKVLTNGYPLSQLSEIKEVKNRRENVRLLIHSGRFSGSDSRRTADLLLGPLLTNLSSTTTSGVIRLIGALTKDELNTIALFIPKFTAIGWRIETPGAIPRTELLAQLPKADGLLLLSASNAALPSKLFEYIPTGLPIFVVTEKSSATWNLCQTLPQAHLFDNSDNCITEDNLPFYKRDGFEIPEKYSESSLSESFIKFIDQRITDFQ